VKVKSVHIIYYLIRISSGFLFPNVAKDITIPKVLAYGVNTLPDKSSDRSK